jgi:hypothetical protein
MQGKNSKSELYKNLKEAYFVNFQCSPLTTPEMIVKAFKEASKLIDDVIKENLNKIIVKYSNLKNINDNEKIILFNLETDYNEMKTILDLNKNILFNENKNENLNENENCIGFIIDDYYYHKYKNFKINKQLFINKEFDFIKELKMSGILFDFSNSISFVKCFLNNKLLINSDNNLEYNLISLSDQTIKQYSINKYSNNIILNLTSNNEIIYVLFKFLKNKKNIYRLEKYDINFIKIQYKFLNEDALSSNFINLLCKKKNIYILFEENKKEANIRVFNTINCEYLHSFGSNFNSLNGNYTIPSFKIFPKIKTNNEKLYLFIYELKEMHLVDEENLNLIYKINFDSLFNLNVILIDFEVDKNEIFFIYNDNKNLQIYNKDDNIENLCKLIYNIKIHEYSQKYYFCLDPSNSFLITISNNQLNILFRIYSGFKI